MAHRIRKSDNSLLNTVRLLTEAVLWFPEVLREAALLQNALRQRPNQNSSVLCGLDSCPPKIEGHSQRSCNRHACHRLK